MYCTLEDLRARLGEAGLLQLVDDDGDGSVEVPGEHAAVAQALQAAAGEIDAALQPHLRLPVLAPNDWLRQRAIDLAAEYLAGRKGAEVPLALRTAAVRTRTWLSLVQAGELRVPDLAYPPRRGRTSGLPRADNPTSKRV